MRYYIIAGERSGDLHGGNLILELRKLDPSAVFRGFGGDDMKKAGMDLAVHYNQMAFMGFVALITNFSTIRKMLRFCKEDILSFKPDVVILIDYGGFNRRIARFAKPRGIKTFYYIPPKIWAWYQSRAKEIKANVDRLFVILPFEKDFYKTYDWEVDYVGNPVLDAVRDFRPNGEFLNKNNFPTDRPLVALLPGSRRMELKRMVPVMAAVASRHPDMLFVVAKVDGLEESLYEPLLNLSQVRFVQGETYDLLSHARAAIVTSGTATLETGLFRVPQVCIYKAGGLEMRILKLIVKVKFISLVNLIAGRQIIRELIQEEANPAAISDEVLKLVSDGPYRNEMLADYAAIYKTLDTGSASANAARLMVGYLRN